MKLTKDQFLDQFTVQFLASWCAKEYNDACLNGTQKRLDTPPVEDARFLAEQAWKHYTYIFNLDNT